MSLAARHIAGFTIAVTLGLAATYAVPGPYPDGVQVERTTGAGRPEPWFELEPVRRGGDLGVWLAGLERQAAGGAAPLAAGLAAVLRAELLPPDFTVDPLRAAPVESLFADVDAGIASADSG